MHFSLDSPSDPSAATADLTQRLADLQSERTDKQVGVVGAKPLLV
jgi:hypothetical protein